MIHSLFNFSNFFVDSFHRFFVSSDGILRFSFLSKIDFEFWIVQFPEAGRTWILCRIAFDISVLSFDRIQFPEAGRHTSREVLLLLLQRLPIAPECHLWRRSRLRVFRIVCTRLPELHSLILCLGQFYPIDGVLIMFSNCCDDALSWEFFSHHWVLLHLDFHRKGWEVWIRWFVVPTCFVFLLQRVHSPGWSLCWRNNSCETKNHFQSRNF